MCVPNGPHIGVGRRINHIPLRTISILITLLAESRVINLIYRSTALPEGINSFFIFHFYFIHAPPISTNENGPFISDCLLPKHRHDDHCCRHQSHCCHCNPLHNRLVSWLSIRPIHPTLHTQHATHTNTNARPAISHCSSTKSTCARRRCKSQPHGLSLVRACNGTWSRGNACLFPLLHGLIDGACFRG